MHGLDETRCFRIIAERFTEPELSKAVTRGVTQYVLSGTGLESFAYRRRDLAGVVRIFEEGLRFFGHGRITHLTKAAAELPHPNRPPPHGVVALRELHAVTRSRSR
jgi:hypothetical protein